MPIAYFFNEGYTVCNSVVYCINCHKIDTNTRIAIKVRKFLTIIVLIVLL